MLTGEIFVRPEDNSDAVFTMKHAILGVEDTCLLVDAAMTLRRGHRYGIVGENGAGKTTLMLAVRDTIEDLGMGAVRVMYVGQNDAERSAACAEDAADYVVAGDVEVRRLRRRLAALEAGDDGDLSDGGSEDAGAGAAGDGGGFAEEMERIMNELELRGADGMRARADALLQRLGFPAVLRAAAVQMLSGGWRTRLEIARALFAQPDVLMLDEPTNHLDLACVLQLATLLVDGDAAAGVPPPPTVVLVSHDATFMDMVCTDIVSVHKTVLQCVPGNYAHFEERADEYRLYHERLYEKRQREEKRVRVSVQQQKASAARDGNDKALRQAASRARKAEDRAGFYREDGKRYKTHSLKKLDIEYVRMPARAEPVRVGKVLTMRLPQGEPALARRASALLQLDGVTLQYPGAAQPVIVGASASVFAGDRIAVVGRNGAGKTTLLRALAEPGFAAVRAGTVRRTGAISVIDQNHLSTLEGHLDESSVAYLRARHASRLGNDESARAHLARFGLGGGEVALLPIAALSGGLRVRLLLADAFACDPLPDILLLDEPTNHLDFESITALGNALKSYGGAIVAVSHNCAFILDVCTTLWVCRPTDPKRPISSPKVLDVQPSHGDAAVFLQNFKRFAVTLVPDRNRAALEDLLTIRATRYSNVTQGAATMSSLLVSS